MASDNDDSVIKVTIAVNAIKEGKIGVPDEPWVQELLAAPRGPTGSVVLKGLSQGAISRARAVSMAVRFMQQQAREHNPEPVVKLDTAEAQAELFRLFAILFAALVGVSAQDISYSDIQGSLLARLKDDGATVSKRVDAATDELHAFYKKNAHPLFQAAKEFGGMKAVLGGQRRFTETTLNGVRVSGLYLDTQLIPDPVFSFITSSIAKDMNAAPLQLAYTIFYLLQLEPLVHAHLATPLVFVFPSFDEGLEEHDAVTQAGLANLTYKVLAPACAGTVESYEEVEEYAKKQPDAFLQEVMKARLFVPQGGDVNITYSWQDAVKLQLEELHGSVSEAYFETIAAMPPEQVVLINTMQRVRGQYHLLENSDELQAQPLVTLPVHWHYYQLCATAEARALVRQQVLSDQAFQTLQALQDDSLSWLGNIPIGGLLELRQNQEHMAFREELKKVTAQLMSAGPADLDQVVREVNHGLKVLVDRQKMAIRDIEDRYRPKNWATNLGIGAGALTGAAMVFMPFLAAALGPVAPAAPFLAALGAGGLGRAKDKAGELAEKGRAKRALLGMLATAYHAKPTGS